MSEVVGCPVCGINHVCLFKGVFGGGVGVVGGAARVYRYMLLLWAGHADMGVVEWCGPVLGGCRAFRGVS